MDLLSPLLLTLNFNGGKIMAEFREEEHPKGNVVKYKSYTSTSLSKNPQVNGNIYIYCKF